MRIGFALPQMGEAAYQAPEVARFARQAEEFGAESLWVADRLLAPVHPSIGYAGSPDIPRAFHAVLDPFVLLSVAAAVTKRVRIGTNIIQAPLYPPALLARSLTSIDLISRGRLIVGFGTGWSPEEYQAAGIPMAQRGARLEECLDALKAWWTTNPVEHQGKYWSIPATHVDLKPGQQPSPPVYLAAFTPAAMERIARRANGWMPVVQPGAQEFDARLINGPMAEIRNIAQQNDREPAELDVILRIYPTADGTLANVLECIEKVRDETDVSHVLVDFMNIAADVDHTLSLAESVLTANR
ncbi:TIGR03619 family F420-dependent LLM class oxidoreductase [Streptomyces flaveolus]|uniref:TIGR03619 family F420-dependent LLM class oxidoreductase n=1 Tax=Streptomyces flaveolus TaxID=67297 RepID=UPI003700F0F3